MRLIDADNFGNRMYHEVFEKDSEDQMWDSGCWMRYKLFERVLREQPTIEPERKKGQWKGTQTVECSECGHLYPAFMRLERYCPNCGADMRGEKDEKDQSNH